MKEEEVFFKKKKLDNVVIVFCDFLLM